MATFEKGVRSTKGRALNGRNNLCTALRKGFVSASSQIDQWSYETPNLVSPLVLHSSASEMIGLCPVVRSLSRVETEAANRYSELSELPSEFVLDTQQLA